MVPAAAPDAVEEEVKVPFIDSNCSWSSVQALRSMSIAACNSASPKFFSTSALRLGARTPIAAPIPAAAPTQIRLAPKVNAAATAPKTNPTAAAVAMLGFLSRDGRSFANSASFPSVFLLIDIHGRKASRKSSRSLSNIWLAVAKEEIVYM